VAGLRAALVACTRIPVFAIAPGRPIVIAAA
jgi:hypothetical protein